MKNNKVTTAKIYGPNKHNIMIKMLDLLLSIVSLCQSNSVKIFYKFIFNYITCFILTFSF